MFKMTLNLLSFREILLNLADISIKKTIVMFSVVLTLSGLRDISTKTYSGVQCGTDFIWLERDLNKEL